MLARDNNHSTTEIQDFEFAIGGRKKASDAGSNPRPSACKSLVLLTELIGLTVIRTTINTSIIYIQLCYILINLIYVGTLTIGCNNSLEENKC